MSRQEISLTRFKWRAVPWEMSKNISAIWIYCKNGLLSFEYELNPGVKIPKINIKRAKNSKNLNFDHFYKITNPKIISFIGKYIKTLDVKGAFGNGIMLNSLDIPFENITKNMKIMTTLIDWNDLWHSSNVNFKRSF